MARHDVAARTGCFEPVGLGAEAAGVDGGGDGVAAVHGEEGVGDDLVGFGTLFGVGFEEEGDEVFGFGGILVAAGRRPFVFEIPDFAVDFFLQFVGKGGVAC